MNDTKCLWITGFCLLMVLAGCKGAAAQINPPQVGVFFDTAGNTCSVTLEPFLPVQAHILAFVEPGVDLSGCFFSLQLPPEMNIDAITWPKNSNQSGTLTSSIGVNLTFQICATTTTEPVTLVSFELTDVSFGGIRPDLYIEVMGGTITAPDTLVLLEANLKVCDPENPEGYADLIVAPSTRATMNCSAGSCPCNETSVISRTWTAVRKLYADD